MSAIDAAAQRIYRYWGHIDYLKCRHQCKCGRVSVFFHPLSDKTRQRLAHDMAEAALDAEEGQEQ